MVTASQSRNLAGLFILFPSSYFDYQIFSAGHGTSAIGLGTLPEHTGAHLVPFSEFIQNLFRKWRFCLIRNGVGLLVPCVPAKQTVAMLAVWSGF
jgi:hypothetical protein